jgi:hypothetical protein
MNPFDVPPSFAIPNRRRHYRTLTTDAGGELAFRCNAPGTRINLLARASLSAPLYVVSDTQTREYQGDKPKDACSENAPNRQYPEPKVFLSRSGVSQKNWEPARWNKEPKAN